MDQLTFGQPRFEARFGIVIYGNNPTLLEWCKFLGKQQQQSKNKTKTKQPRANRYVQVSVMSPKNTAGIINLS